MARQRKTDTPELGLPSHDLVTIEGWDKLESSEQQTVKTETTNLDKALIESGKARLSIGEHLFNIREVLEPKGMFTKFLNCCTRFSRASAYRYVDMFTAASQILPSPVMQQAMLRGTEKINLKAVKASPPPKTTNVTQINDYLDKIQAPVREAAETNPEVLKKECWMKIHSAFQRLPNNSRTRSAWIHSLLGMALTELGVSGAQTVTPVAVPDTYRPARGRPRTVAA